MADAAEEASTLTSLGATTSNLSTLYRDKPDVV